MTTPKRDTRLLIVTFCALFLFLTLTYAGRLSRKLQLETDIAQMELKNEQTKAQQLVYSAAAHSNIFTRVQNVTLWRKKN